MPRPQKLKVQARISPAPMIRPRAVASHTVRAMIDKTQSPVEQAYNHILQSILSGELTPGMRVPAESVAETLGISRMPVRDALRRLEGDGAVMIFTNRGASVAEFSRDEIVQLIEMERSSGDLIRWMFYHDDFHNYLTSLSQRGLLMRQTERMRIMLRPYYRLYYAKTRELEIVGLEHRKIIDAIRKSDPDNLETIVRAHALKNVKKVADLA